MKLTKIIALLLALVCCFASLVSCEDTDDEEVGEAKSLVQTAMDYMNSHPYKVTGVVISEMDGYEQSSTSIEYHDGLNYSISDDGSGMSIIYHDGVAYVISTAGKKKMTIDLNDLSSILGDGYSDAVGGMTDSLVTMYDNMSNDDFKLEKNDDGTSTVTLAINVPYLGEVDYVITLDKDGRIVRIAFSYETTVMNYTVTATCEETFEYSDDFKINPPADADEYELATDYFDLIGLGTY